MTTKGLESKLILLKDEIIRKDVQIEILRHVIEKMRTMTDEDIEIYCIIYELAIWIDMNYSEMDNDEPYLIYSQYKGSGYGRDTWHNAENLCIRFIQWFKKHFVPYNPEYKIYKYEPSDEVKGNNLWHIENTAGLFLEKQNEYEKFKKDFIG